MSAASQTTSKYLQNYNSRYEIIVSLTANRMSPRHYPDKWREFANSDFAFL